jgi:hypothetical protein
MPLDAPPGEKAYQLREQTEAVIRRFEIACRQEAVRLQIDGLLLIDYATLVLAERLAERSLLVDTAFLGLAKRIAESKVIK